VLRGVAVLGMLAVHIQLFAFPSAARWNPTAYGDFRGINWLVWLVTSLLADGKFISIFATLLGASIVMLPQTAANRGVPAWRVHVLRMGALLVLGLVHAYGVWYGDMLVPLALCGFVVYLARGLSPRWLIGLGVAAFVAGSLITIWLGWSLLHGPPAELADWKDEVTPRRVRIAEEINHYQGGWADQMRYRVPMAREIQTWGFLTRLFWETAGLMLIGMALFKLRVLTAALSETFYRRLMVIGFCGGLVLISLGLWRSFATRWDALDYLMIGQELRVWGNLLVALGWVAVVMLLCRIGWRLSGIAAVGRTALTNYLLQSLICTTVFYGHGFGLFAEVGRVGQLGIVLAIWAFELLASTAWLRYFAVGPVEWFVRWVAFGRRPQFVRSAAAAEL
jgi:uncharacterized protein